MVPNDVTTHDNEPHQGRDITKMPLKPKSFNLKTPKICF